MNELPAGSVDLVLADLPYGTTAARWDSIIPFPPLWDHYRRILKPDGVVALTACMPFTAALVMSNPKWFRYEWIWDKVQGTGYLDAKRRPLRRHESVVIFSRRRPRYTPQMVPGKPYRQHRKAFAAAETFHDRTVGDERITQSFGDRYPTSILSFNNSNARGKVHPTQKPVPLMEYLIRTYTQPGDLVVDNAMGSGTTGVAAANLDRRFLGIERDPGYFHKATDRIAAALAAHDHELTTVYHAPLLQA